jgi:DNA uptake protein ComE-like DNA-binding protein
LLENFMTFRATSAIALLVTLAMAPFAMAQVGPSTALLNPNTAEPTALKGLPHVTEPLVQAIVAGRPFPNTAAFNTLLAKSLTEAQRTELYGRLFLAINLNTASRADIMLIPGMTNRMAHEFEEYRPYKNIEQFRKEIGKYVDAKEVARLESYVTLK